MFYLSKNSLKKKTEKKEQITISIVRCVLIFKKCVLLSTKFKNMIQFNFYFLLLAVVVSEKGLTSLDQTTAMHGQVSALCPGYVPALDPVGCRVSEGASWLAMHS